MSQQCTSVEKNVSALQQLIDENQELQRYLDAQRKVITSLERRVGRSLESLGVHLKGVSTQPEQSSTWQESITSVQQEVDSLCDLLADAMLLQKLEAGKVMAHLERLPLGPLLSSVSRHLLQAKENNPVRLICEFESNLPDLRADQELLEAVLIDLLARAFRYSDSDSPVILGVKRVESQVHICITTQRFAPIGNRDFATEIALCCRRIEVQNGKVTCQYRGDGLQTVTIALESAD